MGVLRRAAQDGCSGAPRSRFISSDPLGLGGGQPNFFAYVGDAPTKLTDPTGRGGGSADDAWAAVKTFNGWEWVHSGPGAGGAGGNNSATGGGGSGGDSSENDTAGQIAAYEAAQSGANSPLGVAEADAGIGAGEMAAVSGPSVGAPGSLSGIQPSTGQLFARAALIPLDIEEFAEIGAAIGEIGGLPGIAIGVLLGMAVGATVAIVEDGLIDSMLFQGAAGAPGIAGPAAPSP